MNREIPELLKKYIVEVGNGKVKYTPSLKFILKHFIAEFLGLEYQDGLPNSLTQGADSYKSLAKKINKWIDITDNIKGSYLRNICFPSKTALTPPKEMDLLLIIYNFFVQHFEKSSKNIEYWIKELEKDPQPSEFSIGDTIPLIYGGAETINNDFIKDINRQDKEIKPRDFYLNSDDYSQWYGIIHDWCYPREIYTRIRANIIDSFLYPFKIPAVIHSHAGYGKSLGLRYLAFNCMNEGFIVLWIINFDAFITSCYGSISKSAAKYLLFFDEWSLIDDNQELVRRIIDFIQSTDNIRLIITDRNPQWRKYRKYSGNNLFEISSNDNPDIIKRIAKTNREWRAIVKMLDIQKQIIVPLYMTIFMIDRYEEGDVEMLEADDILVRFKEIIEYDLKLLGDVYEGLAIALVYWAQVYESYRYPITWKAFLELANYYNGDNLVSTHLFQFDNGASIITVLSHYIGRLGFINPDLDNVHFIFFHDDLLVKVLSGSSLNLKGFTKFKTPPAFEIVEILINRGMTNSAYDLGSSLLDNGYFNKKMFGDKQRYLFIQNHLRLFPEKFQYIGVNELIYYDHCLNSYYKYATENTTDKEWVGPLNSMIYVLGFSKKTLTTILKRIIDLGCSSECVKRIYELVLKNRISKVVETMDFFDTEPYHIWWPVIRMSLDDKSGNRPKKFVELAEDGEIIYSSFQISKEFLE
ncbi:MAG: hypothetical protein ABIN91_19110 [Mucilaginibacter sp.]|uniref:hypothetical protein n=1 Tax=Mucilaginibacter sp. TaxID=1882438 RepID=UPI003266512C